MPRKDQTVYDDAIAAVVYPSPEQVDTPERRSQYAHDLADKVSSKCGIKFSRAFFIVHDKDPWLPEDDAVKKGLYRAGHLKKLHGHFVGELAEGSAVKGKDFDDALGDMGKADYPKLRKNKNKPTQRFDAMAFYLAHTFENHEKKYPYSPDEVITVCGDTSYAAYHAANYGRVAAERADAHAKSSIVSLLKDIEEGKYKNFRDIAHDTKARKLYSASEKNSKLIDYALSTASKFRMIDSADDCNAGLFCKFNPFITGKERSGKDLLLDAFQNVTEEIGLDSFKGTASHAIEKYAGEDGIRLSDVRGNAMPAEAWLTLEDPHHSNPADARYNKLEDVAPRWIAITSCVEPIDFFAFSKNVGGGDGRSENVDQFLGRLACIVKVYPPYLYGTHNIRLMEAVNTYMPHEIVLTEDLTVTVTHTIRDIEPYRMYSPAAAIGQLFVYFRGCMKGQAGSNCEGVPYLPELEQVTPTLIRASVDQAYAGAVAKYAETDGAKGVPPLCAPEDDGYIDLQAVYEDYTCYISGIDYDSWLDAGAPLAAQGGANACKFIAEHGAAAAKEAIDKALDEREAEAERERIQGLLAEQEEAQRRKNEDAERERKEAERQERDEEAKRDFFAKLSPEEVCAYLAEVKNDPSRSYDHSFGRPLPRECGVSGRNY